MVSFADTCNLSQVITKPTRICCRADGSQSSTSSIFTDVAELCSKAISIPVSCRDHNLIAVGRRTKVPKSGQKITLKRIIKSKVSMRGIKAKKIHLEEIQFK